MAARDTRNWIDKSSLPRLTRSARLYADNLLNKEVGLVSRTPSGELEYVSVPFKAQHFAHLAGVKTVNPRALSAVDLFEKALKRRLRPNGIVYTHNKSLFGLKNELFAELASLPTDVSKMAEYGIESQISINATKVMAGPPACLGLLEIDGEYIPTSLLSADIRVLAKGGDVSPVLATTVKEIGKDEPATLRFMKGHSDDRTVAEVTAYLAREGISVSDPILPKPKQARTQEPKRRKQRPPTFKAAKKVSLRTDASAAKQAAQAQLSRHHQQKKNSKGAR